MSTSNFVGDTMMHWPCRLAPGFCQPLQSFRRAPSAAPSRAELVAALMSNASIPSRGFSDTLETEAACSTAKPCHVVMSRDEAAAATRNEDHPYCYLHNIYLKART